ncbi:MAG: type II secretion system protein [Candidatus Pacebacteria bacterium]|nr:type II secretion system protein [Candidatus Paceibacterota bacterium]
MKKNDLIQTNKGFTLIEMIVSVGIFITVLSVSMGGLVTVVSSNDKAQAIRVAMDNMNFVMEEMSRHVTQGNTYHCGEAGDIDTTLSCATGGSSIYFQSNKIDIDRIHYQLSGGEILKSTTGANPVTNVPLTTLNILTIKDLTFYVFADEGANPDDQPRVIISISGEVKVGGETTTFNVQTTTTQRIPISN